MGRARERSRQGSSHATYGMSRRERSRSGASQSSGSSSSASSFYSLYSTRESLVRTPVSNPAPPPPPPLWRFSVRKAAVSLSVETSTEKEFVTKFEMRKEMVSVMVQEPSLAAGSPRLKVFTVQVADFVRELGKEYYNCLCFSRSFPDEHEFIGTVKEIRNGNVTGSVQIHPNLSDDSLVGTLYLVHSKQRDEEDEKSDNRGRSRNVSRDGRSKSRSQSRRRSVDSKRKQSKRKVKSQHESDDETETEVETERKPKSRQSSRERKHEKSPSGSRELKHSKSQYEEEDFERHSKKAYSRSGSKERHHSKSRHGSEDETNERNKSKSRTGSTEREHSEHKKQSKLRHGIDEESSLERKNQSKSRHGSEDDKHHHHHHKQRAHSRSGREERKHETHSQSHQSNHKKKKSKTRNGSRDREHEDVKHANARHGKDEDVGKHDNSSKSKSREGRTVKEHRGKNEKSNSRQASNDEHHHKHGKQSKPARESESSDSDKNAGKTRGHKGGNGEERRGRSRKREEHSHSVDDSAEDSSRGKSESKSKERRAKELKSQSKSRKDSSSENEPRQKHGGERKQRRYSKSRDANPKTVKHSKYKVFGLTKSVDDAHCKKQKRESNSEESDDERSNHSRKHSKKHPKRTKAVSDDDGGRRFHAKKSSHKKEASKKSQHSSDSDEIDGGKKYVPKRTSSKHRSRHNSSESDDGNRKHIKHTKRVEYESDASDKQPKQKKDKKIRGGSEEKSEHSRSRSRSHIHHQKSDESDVEMHHPKERKGKPHKDHKQSSDDDENFRSSSRSHSKKRHGSVDKKKSHEDHGKHSHSKSDEEKPLKRDGKKGRSKSEESHGGKHEGKRRKSNYPSSDSDISFHKSRSKTRDHQKEKQGGKKAEESHRKKQYDSFDEDDLDEYFIFTNPRAVYVPRSLSGTRVHVRYDSTSSSSGRSTPKQKRGGLSKGKRGRDLSVGFYESQSESSWTKESGSEPSYDSDGWTGSSASDDENSGSSIPSAASSAESLQCDCLSASSHGQNNWISARLKAYESTRLKEEREWNESQCTDDPSETRGRSESEGAPTATTDTASTTEPHTDAVSTNVSGTTTPKAAAVNEEKDAKRALSVFKSIQRYSAVNPGSGEIILPANIPPAKGELAAEELVLDFVHGYRTRDVSNNAFYLDNDLVVFPAGSVGVIMDIKKRSQRFFQGRHRQEIATLSVHPSKRLVVTGDTIGSGGDGTYIYIWDPKSPEDVQRQVQIRVGDRLARGVADVCFTSCGKYVIAAGMDESRTVYVYNWQKAGKLLVKASYGTTPNTIFGIGVNPQVTANEFVTFGVKHVTFWKLDASQGKLASVSGSFGDGEVFSVLSCCYLSSSSIATGTHRGAVLVWEKHSVVKVLNIHEGPVFSVRFQEKLGLISGGRDGYIVRQSVSRWDVEGKLLAPASIISIDVNDHGHLLVGMEGSQLVEMKEFGHHKVMERGNCRVIMEGHSVAKNREVWGCAMNPRHQVEYATAGDDSMVILRNIHTKEIVSKTHLQGKLKAIAYSPDGKYIAVGNDNGDIFVLKSPDLTQVHFQKYDQPKDVKSRVHGINVVKFSPDGRYLACGGHDDVVYIWTLLDGFKVALMLKGHTSYITHLDWGTGSDYLRSNSHSETLIWTVPGAETVKSTPNVQWSTNSCTLDESIRNGDHVLSIDRSPGDSCFVTGDDYGGVKLFSTTVKGPLAPYKLYSGHAENVTNVKFDSTGRWLISTGGGDGCVLEWRVQKG